MSWSGALGWRAEFTSTADKQITRLDQKAQAGIVRYLRERVQAAENPRRVGKALHGEKQGLWRYRIGEYRIICNIQDEENKVLVLAASRRKGGYR